MPRHKGSQAQLRLTSAVKLGRKSYPEGFGLAGRNSLLTLPFAKRVQSCTFQGPGFREYPWIFLVGLGFNHGLPGVPAFGLLWGPGPQLGFVVHKTDSSSNQPPAGYGFPAMPWLATMLWV